MAGSIRHFYSLFPLKHFGPEICHRKTKSWHCLLQRAKSFQVFPSESTAEPDERDMSSSLVETNAAWALSQIRAAGSSIVRAAEGPPTVEDACAFRSVPFAVRGKKTCQFRPQHDRYMNVVPYEDTRVRLEGDGGDYINACHVTSKPGDLARFSYIATQGPLEETVDDFWRMVCQQKVSAIVMLCDLVEDMMPKCARYFPFDPSAAFETPSYVVRAKSLERPRPGVERRSLEVTETATGATATLDHFRYSDWPDHGIPDQFDSMLEISNRIRSDYYASRVVVHCSAGIGRTGTFCMIDIVLRRVLNAEVALISALHSKFVDLDALLLDLRGSRLGMVQTVEQFKFSRDAIIAGLSVGL